MAQGADNSPLLVHDENSEGRFSKPISEEGHLISGQRSRKKFLVVVCILFVELCERLTFYGVVANLIFYCKDVLNLASPLPSTIALASEGLEFAYSQSPAELRGVVMGLCLAMIGFGYYLASALASIVKKASDGQWYPENLNKGTLEDYMFLLAGLMLVNAAVFLLLALRYRYADHEHHIQEEDLSHTSGEKDRIDSYSGDVSK